MSAAAEVIALAMDALEEKTQTEELIDAMTNFVRETEEGRKRKRGRKGDDSGNPKNS